MLIREDQRDINLWPQAAAIQMPPTATIQMPPAALNDFNLAAIPRNLNQAAPIDEYLQRLPRMFEILPQATRHTPRLPNLIPAADISPRMARNINILPHAASNDRYLPPASRTLRNVDVLPQARTYQREF